MSVKEKSMEHTLDYKSPPAYSTYNKRHREKFGDLNCITEDEFNVITSKDCTYCGKPGPNGIDRLDCDKGYEKENCVPCCKHCNYVKGNLSMKDFRAWVKRFVGHQMKTIKFP